MNAMDLSDLVRLIFYCTLLIFTNYTNNEVKFPLFILRAVVDYAALAGIGAGAEGW